MMTPSEARSEKRERLIRVRDCIRSLPDLARYRDPWVLDQLTLTGRAALTAISKGQGITRLHMGLICGMTENEDGGRCGCVIGVTTMLFPEEMKRAYAVLEIGFGYGSPPIGSAAAEILGLNGDQACALFYGTERSTEEESLQNLSATETEEESLQNLSATEVVRAIDAILSGKEGNEIWDEAEGA